MIFDESSTMPVFRHPALLGLHYTELLGRLSLSQADVTQRLQYLACRLSMGVMENSLRQFILRRDEAYYAADCVELEERLGVLFDAGAEGCVTILRSYIEEFTNAHIRCLEAAFETGGEALPLRLLPFVPQRALPAPGLPGLKRGAHR
jgi:hypothetical protein